MRDIESFFFFATNNHAVRKRISPRSIGHQRHAEQMPLIAVSVLDVLSPLLSVAPRTVVVKLSLPPLPAGGGVIDTELVCCVPELLVEPELLLDPPLLLLFPPRLTVGMYLLRRISSLSGLSAERMILPSEFKFLKSSCAGSVKSELS